jgi:hypothetical protein
MDGGACASGAATSRAGGVGTAVGSHHDAEFAELERASWAAIEEVMRQHRERVRGADESCISSIRQVHSTYYKRLETTWHMYAREAVRPLEATVEELQRQNVELLKGCHKVDIREALALVKEDPEEAMRRMDEVAGIHEDLTTGAVTGTTRAVRQGLRILPLWMVRGLEYEAVGRKVGLDASVLREMDALFVSESLTSYRLDGKEVVLHLSREEYRGVGFGKWALGTVYTFGASAVEKDPEESMRLMREAVLLGNADAAYSLGCVAERLARDTAAARKWYELAVSWGHGLAANNLGSLLLQGASDVPMNAPEARRNFVLAIERGERLYAPMNLGELYLAGAPGVDQDPARAAQYLLLALSEGDSVARLGARRSMHELIMMQERKEVEPTGVSRRRSRSRVLEPRKESKCAATDAPPAEDVTARRD